MCRDARDTESQTNSPQRQGSSDRQQEKIDGKKAIDNGEQQPSLMPCPTAKVAGQRSYFRPAKLWLCPHFHDLWLNTAKTCQWQQ